MKSVQSLARIIPPFAASAFLCLLAPTNATAAEQTAPRYSFHKGEKLTYEFTQRSSMHGGTAGQDIKGRAVLRVLDVRRDGTAVIEMVTSGSGAITMGGQTENFESSKPSRIVAIVRPNGSIVQFQDPNGRKRALITPELDFFVDVGSNLQMAFGMTYTVFGLQLPDKLPAPGGKWTVYHKHESLTGPDPSKLKVKMEQKPATFTFVGKRDYKGRSCLAFSWNAPFMEVPAGIPETFYFDAAKGQLVGGEIHQERFVSPEGKLDRTIVLAMVE